MKSSTLDCSTPSSHCSLICSRDCADETVREGSLTVLCLHLVARRSKRIEKLGGDPEVEGGSVQLVAEGAGAEPPSHAHQGGRQHLQLACQQVHSPQRAEHTPPEGVG